jgi:hypothetical protein
MTGLMLAEAAIVKICSLLVVQPIRMSAKQNELKYESFDIGANLHNHVPPLIDSQGQGFP